jgi:hypothetical protein
MIFLNTNLCLATPNVVASLPARIKAAELEPLVKEASQNKS